MNPEGRYVRFWDQDMWNRNALQATRTAVFDYRTQVKIEIPPFEHKNLHQGRKALGYVVRYDLLEIDFDRRQQY